MQPVPENRFRYADCKFNIGGASGGAGKGYGASR